MNKCLIVFNKDNRFIGFNLNGKYLDAIKNMLLKCSTTEDVIEKFDDPNEFDFETFENVNINFNESKRDYLFVLRDGAWYCREQGSLEFKDIRIKDEPIVEEEDEDEEEPETNNKVVSVEDNAKVIEYRICQLEDQIEKLSDMLTEFEEAYVKDQRLNFFIVIALTVLLAVVGIIAIFG